MKRLLLSIACLFMLTGSIWAQERAISGKISDGSGEALPGVTVLVKGTTTGTQSNFEGEFKLNVPADGTHLIFSFVGMASQEVEIGNQTEFAVTMAEDTQQLSEIVVTAQGIVKTRNELTYSAQQIGGDEVNKTRNANFVNNLSGKVAGVNVKRTNNLGGSTNVVIRGITSLTGSNQALFIVDGVPIDNTAGKSASQSSGRGGYDYGNAAADINPDDIESVNVLKGAAATVLYGARASNGVILITTKKGKSQKGIGVTLNIGGSMDKIDESTFIKQQTKYGAGYGPFYEDPSGYFLYRDVNGDGSPELVVPVTEDASWGAAFDPSLMVYHWDAFDPTSPNYLKKKPWVAAANGPITFFETGKSSNVSLAVDGQTDKGYFKFSYTRNDQTGILPGGNIGKDNASFGASYKLTDKLSVSTSINLVNQEAKGRNGTGYDDKNLMGNFRQWWQTNVDIKDLKDAYERTGKNTTWNWSETDASGPIFWDNPYFTRYENYQNDSRLRYFGYTSLTYEATDWLSITGRASVDTYNSLREERQAIGSVTTAAYSRRDITFKETNFNLIANFKKDINEDLKFTGLLGTNSRLTTRQNIFSATNGGMVLPNFYTLNNSLNTPLAPTESYSQLKVVGVFANASFAYKKMLFLDASLRNDTWSSLPTENNSFFYPAVSGAFSFTDLIGSNDIFTAGKLRASYAEIGSGGVPQRLTDVYTNTSPFGSTPKYSIPGRKNNSNLKEERTKDLEFGLEVSFLDGRLGIDMSYYNRTTEDLIVPVSISRATGYSQTVLNAGTIENKGLELILFAKPIKTDDFSWNMSINFTRNRNKVVSLAKGLDNLQLASFQGGVSLNAAVGEPYGIIRGTDYLYDDSGNKIVGGSNNTYSKTNNNAIIGDANPDWLAGFNNSFRYKNLGLSFLIDVRQGGDIFSLDMYYGMETGMYPETAGLNELGNPVRSPLSEGGGVIFEGVRPDGSVNTGRVSPDAFRMFGYRGNPNKAFVYDASYVKFRELALTYSLPSTIMEQIKIAKSIDISIVGRNLWIISKNTPYFDPEANFGAGNTSSGYSSGSQPMTRNIGFNLKLKF